MEWFWQGKPKYSEKTCPDAILSTTNPTCQTRARTRAAVAGSQRLTASAMARPNPGVNAAINFLQPLFAVTGLLFQGPSHIMKLRPVLNSGPHIKPIPTHHITITFHMIPFIYSKGRKSSNLCMIQ
jgi:hypothetical protein